MNKYIIIYHHRTLGDGAEGIHIREMIHAFRILGHSVYVNAPFAKKDRNSQNHKSKYKLITTIKQKLPTLFYEMIEISYGCVSFFQMLYLIKKYKADFIYDRYSLFSFGCVLAGKVSRCPVFLEVNAPLAYEREREPDERLFLKKVAYWFEIKICSNSTLTYVVSSPLMNYLKEIGVKEKKLLVLPNGANYETFIPKNDDSPPIIKQKQSFADSVIIGFVGILRKWHGLEILLEAFAFLDKDVKSKTYIVLIGGGPAESEIMSYARKLQIDKNIIVVDRISHSEVVRYIQSFDIAVSPKSTFYASPMKVFEYMACSVPVIVPDAPNYRDFINPDVTGLTFHDQDHFSLANRLKELIESHDKRERIGKTARESIVNRYNWQWNAYFIVAQFDKMKLSRTTPIQ